MFIYWVSQSLTPVLTKTWYPSSWRKFEKSQMPEYPHVSKLKTLSMNYPHVLRLFLLEKVVS